MAPRDGFEPSTNRLTAGCSTAELPRNFRFSITAKPPSPALSAATPAVSEVSGRRKKRGPEFPPAPRLWVMVGCLQGKTGGILRPQGKESLNKTIRVRPNRNLEATSGIEPE